MEDYGEVEGEDVRIGGGIAVSFLPLDFGILEGLNMKEEVNEYMYNIQTGTRNLFFGKINTQCDEVLVNYSKNVESKGTYLISDLMVQKSLTLLDENNQVYVNDIEDISEDNVEILKQLGCYDESTNLLTIENIEGLTIEEYNSLLIIVGDVTSSYNFAAENQFHANYAYTSSGAVTNAGVGETASSKEPNPYADEFNYYQQDQYDIHHLEYPGMVEL